MRHFLFEEKEYAYRPQFRRNRKQPDSARELARLFRALAPKGNRRGGGGSGGLRRGDFRQKCAVKMQYSDSMDAHRLQLERYLTREGTERDGSRAKLYGTDIDEYRANMVPKNIRIFISPQKDGIGLKKLTETFVKKLELQTGYKLYWQAANHYNTAHPHAHLLINGVDRDGKAVRFPPDVVKTFMRESARDICTAQIGNRTRRELETEREAELSAPRWTRLDQKILDAAGEGRRLHPSESPDRERVAARLEALRKMRLCVFENGKYRLGETWDDSLRANGRYNCFLRAREELRLTDLKVYSGKDGEIAGKVAKAYRTDGDASDSHALVIEGADGKAWFVPLLKKPETGPDGKRKAVAEGDAITVRARENQKGRLVPELFRRGERGRYR